MTDRPIIFSAPMVRALLDGRKTMTRRLARRYVPIYPGVECEHGYDGCPTCDAPKPSPWQSVRPGAAMPIRPENKDRYPKDRPEISQRIRARADNRCEQCGVYNYALGGRASNGSFVPALPLGERALRLEWPKPGDWARCEDGGLYRIVRIVLTVAHLDHTPEHCHDDNLKALCQRCHNRLDAPMRRRGIAERAKAGRAAGDLFNESNTG